MSCSEAFLTAVQEVVMASEVSHVIDDAVVVLIELVGHCATANGERDAGSLRIVAG